MFKFGFLDEPKAEDETPQASSPDVDTFVEDPAQEIPMPSEPSGVILPTLEMIELASAFSIVKSTLSQEQIATIVVDDGYKDTDLIPGKYEGGFKIWEGGIDLAAYLIDSLPEAKGLRVLELGCGHGLPGIVCMIKGAEVHFQDYNKEVLDVLTMVNVDANVKQHRLKNVPQTRYFSGGWRSLSKLVDTLDLAGSYDLIITAETVYNLEAIQTLYECIKQCLKPSGTAIIAAKSYYFGVGGGTSAFEAAVEKELFTVEHLRSIQDGSNIRDIIN